MQVSSVVGDIIFTVERERMNIFGFVPINLVTQCSGVPINDTNEMQGGQCIKHHWHIN